MKRPLIFDINLCRGSQNAIFARALAAVCAGLLFTSNPVISESPRDGQDQLLLAQAKQRQMVRERPANPFSYEYVSGSLGGFRSIALDELYFGDTIDCSVVNAGPSNGVVQIEIHGTERNEHKVVKRSGVSTIGPGAVFFLKYTIPGQTGAMRADAYWVRIKTSNEFLLPRVKSTKIVPENQPGNRIRTIADYTPGDFAVFSTDPRRRIW